MCEYVASSIHCIFKQEGNNDKQASDKYQLILVSVQTVATGLSIYEPLYCYWIFKRSNISMGIGYKIQYL